MGLFILYDSFHNGFCGVNNYAKKLSLLFERESPNFSQKKIINVHYPMMGAKFSFFILIKSFYFKIKSCKIVLTLHEYKHSSFLRRVSSSLLLLVADHIVLTNQQEYEFLKKFFFVQPEKISIIPVFSSIPSQSIDASVTFSKRKILFFGNFYPGRMVVEIIDEFKRLKLHGFSLIICGSPNSRHLDYYEKMKSLSSLSDNIFFFENQSDGQVASLLGECFCSFGLYPQGISSKRSSALAMLAVGLPLITNLGSETDSLLVDSDSLCVFTSLDECLSKLLESEYYFQKSKLGIDLYRRNFSNEKIIERYSEVFNEV